MKLEKTESLKFNRKSKSKSPSPATTPRRTTSTSSLAKKRSRLNSLDYDMKYDSKQVSKSQLYDQIIFLSILIRCGRVVRDFEREAKTRCNFQFR